jgi:hypothetical protein
MAGQGAVWQAGLGVSRCGLVGYGWVRQARLGKVWYGTAWCGGAGVTRQGVTRQVLAGLGMAGAA